jgi:hypothetical protein
MSQVQSAPHTCESCRQPIPVCGGVSYGSLESGYRELCNRCFNEEIARSDGIDFQHVEFQPLESSMRPGSTTNFISACVCSAIGLPWMPSSCAMRSLAAITSRPLATRKVIYSP